MHVNELDSVLETISDTVLFSEIIVRAGYQDLNTRITDFNYSSKVVKGQNLSVPKLYAHVLGHETSIMVSSYGKKIL